MPIYCNTSLDLLVVSLNLLDILVYAVNAILIAVSLISPRESTVSLCVCSDQTLIKPKSGIH